MAPTTSALVAQVYQVVARYVLLFLIISCYITYAKLSRRRPSHNSPTTPTRSNSKLKAHKRRKSRQTRSSSGGPPSLPSSPVEPGPGASTPPPPDKPPLLPIFTGELAKNTWLKIKSAYRPSETIPVKSTETKDTVRSAVANGSCVGISEGTCEPPPNQIKRKVKQRYDAYLVLDIEATCIEGTDFSWPNEIIEWPIVLLKWQDKDEDGRASELKPLEEFRSFVKPTWRPRLSEFCVTLTGISQTDVDSAPTFPELLEKFARFLSTHGLIDLETGASLIPFAFCTDGPFDIRDFVVKQCFISKVRMPDWLKGDVIDVRKTVNVWLESQSCDQPPAETKPSASPLPPIDSVDRSKAEISPRMSSRPSYTTFSHTPRASIESISSVTTDSTQYPITPSSSSTPSIPPRRQPLTIPRQLRALSLAPFKGRQHSGIDDARNISRILAELARRGVALETNLIIRPNKRWFWMGRDGNIQFPDISPSKQDPYFNHAQPQLDWSQLYYPLNSQNSNPF